MPGHRDKASVNSASTWAGCAIPVVSHSETRVMPISAKRAISSMTRDKGTRPSKGRPKLVDREALIRARTLGTSTAY
jgi:hypothetical protein